MILSDCCSGNMDFATLENINRSFKKKKVMNKTDARPIPKLLTMDKILFKKFGIKFKLIFEVRLEVFKAFDESIP